MRGRVLAAVAAAALVAGGASASTVVDGATKTRAKAPTRYSLVHGCFALNARTGRKQAIAKSVGPFRMQAASLGTYLLYGKHSKYLTDSGGGKLAGAGSPSTAAEWRVTGTARKGFKITNLSTHRTIPVTFVRARKCALYPEAQVDAIGKPSGGPSPGATVSGTMEGHAHITAFDFIGGDFHCGRPWHPFGAPWALPADCSHYQVGTNGAFEEALDFGGPRPSDMHGWPTFKEWPTPTSLVEEGDYYTAVERAWKAGLRLFVNQLVDNEALCDVMTVKHNPCNDMASVHIQDRDLHSLQGYIDAQSGGPGKGWFRIVHDPFQARRVINQGKMAVVEGIEVSRILGCGVHFSPTGETRDCNRAQVDAGLKEVRKLGIRTFFPVHEFDNAFGGTKMIAGEAGAIVNAGNRDKTGSFWTVKHCSAQVQDAEQVTPPPVTGAFADLLNGPMASLLGGNPVPVYPPAPHCNVRGMTDLGVYLINKMIQQHLIIQTDHMSSKTADTAVKIAADHHYSGIVSAHCCSSPQLFKRIYATGGYVNPPVRPGEGFATTWKQDKAVRNRATAFGFGWGSDMNGLGSQPGPTTPTIKYPFRSHDGRVKFTREVWGARKFDFNKEGLSNYGLYADWLEQVRKAGGPAMVNDMFHGAESYLQMWERADGVPARHCQGVARFGRGGIGRELRLGATRTATLFHGGQPAARPGRSYRYCVASAGHRRGTISVVFDKHGRVALIASNAGGELAGGIGAGSAVHALVGHAKQLRPGVWVGPKLKYGAQDVYLTRNGHVRVAGLMNGADAASTARQRADLHAANL